MSLGRTSIERPVLALVLSIVILIVGAVALGRLPVSQYPEIVPPTVTVSAQYPGASAQTIADTVATPIEQEINGVDNMLYMYSQSTNDGRLSITVTFALGTNLDEAQVLVQNRVALADPRLPETVRRVGVAVRKNAPDFLLVIQLLSPDNSRDQLYLSNFASTRIRDVLLRLPGVGDVVMYGARDYAMRVWIDPDRAAESGLTAQEIVDAIRAQNVQVAGGVLGQPPIDSPSAFQPTVTLQGRLAQPEEYERIIVKRGEGGRVVRLSDVARTELGARDYNTNAYLNGQPLIAMLVFQRPGTNALATSTAVQKAMEDFRRDFPPGVEYRMTYNPTEFFVRTSIDELVRTIYEAIVLVVLVVIVFLQGWRTTLIPLLAIPVSLIGTFAVMLALGYSMNTLTLFALVLAVGIVVDDAIVVVENVERHLSEGLSAKDAARRTMDEVGGAVVSIALVLTSVFVPTMFVEGISGQFFRQFAVVISVATLISAFNSLTLSPALASLLLKPHDHHAAPTSRPGILLQGAIDRFNRGFDRLSHFYGRLVDYILRHTPVMLGVYVLLIALTAFAFTRVPTGFVPSADQGYLIAVAQLPAGSSLARSDAVVKRMADEALKVPGVQWAHMFTGFVGSTGTNNSAGGTVFVQLTPFDQRKAKNLSANAILAEVQKRFAGIEEAQIGVFAPPTIRGIGTAGGFAMRVQDYKNRGPRLLSAAVQDLVAAANADPRMRFALSPFQVGSPEIFVDVDRAKAQMLQVPVERIFSTLETYLGTAYVNDFNLVGRTFQVRAQADQQFRLAPEQIARLRTRADTGSMVPLGSVADFTTRTAPDRVPRYNLYPTAEVIGEAKPGISSGATLQLMEEIAGRTLPDGFGLEWTDLSYQQKLAAGGLGIFLLSVVFVFLVLAAQYESWTLPFAVILIVPMCLLSAMAGVALRGQDNNILTQVGLVVLVGLAAKNAILIVEFARQLEHDGRTPREAVIESCRLRLRPILMTSFAFILGVVPLLTAIGAGAELRQAIGTAVFFGMLGVTIFGLFFTPIFYVLVRRLALWREGIRPVAAAPAQ
ncbi:MAG: bepG [Rhodospirillales bacterium]|nr:bepG [Rhodospirillales bacterium]